MKQNYIKSLLASLVALLTPMSLMALEKDGLEYLISSAEDLMEFAQLVNAGEIEAEAQLMADIDTRKLGKDFIPIGTQENPYCGRFYGNNHRITIDLVSTHDNYGLFSSLNKSGYISNLYVDGTIEAKHNNVGGIVGMISSIPSVQECTSNVNITVSKRDVHDIGGIIGWSYCLPGINIAHVENCIYTGHIMGHTDGSCAGIVGFCHTGYDAENRRRGTSIRNCLVTGVVDIEIPTLTNHIIAGGETPYTDIKNCYFINPCEIDGEFYDIGVERGGMTRVTMEQVESGEVCYRLNVDPFAAILGAQRRTTIFRQNIGVDKYPVYDISHGIVTKIESFGYGTWAGGSFNGVGSAARTPKGVEAFAGTIDGDTLILHPVKVMDGSQGIAYIIKGEPGYYSLMPTSEKPTAVKNNLSGGIECVDTRYATYYVLGVENDVVGFYRLGSYIKALDSFTAFILDRDLDADVNMLPFVFEGPTIGDANGDGKVTITDAVAVVNYILGTTQEKFDKLAADVNEDGEITITDAVGIVNIILNADSAGVKERREREEVTTEREPD